MKPDKNIKPDNDCLVHHIGDHDYYLCKSINNLKYECPYFKTYAFCINPDRHNLTQE